MSTMIAGRDVSGPHLDRTKQEPPVIKTILVPATGTETDIATFGAALQIARLFGAHIDALHVQLDPVATLVAMTTEENGAAVIGALVEQLAQGVREREAKARGIFTEFCGRERLSITAAPTGASPHPSAQWHVETGEEPTWMTNYGLAADLIVASRGTTDDATARSTLEAVLVQTGRPLLIPNTGAPSVEMAERIAIAWKPTPQTARAVAAAMPFLARAKEIVVMTVQEEEGRSDDADRLVRNLEWHGLKAIAQPLSPDGRSAAETLVAAAEGKVGLLVMGGYGHSRLREWVFGGFTQQLLVNAPMPVLMVH
jgi:nucleotide-binding universal stress UspA family protein